MRYEFHPEALDEYNEAGHYYAQRQPGLDLRFIVSVEEAIERILEEPYPDQGPEVWAFPSGTSIPG